MTEQTPDPLVDLIGAHRPIAGDPIACSYPCHWEGRTRAEHAAHVAAVIRAAQADERVCYSDECAEPCQSWQARMRADLADARQRAGITGHSLGAARAEVAALRAALGRIRAGGVTYPGSGGWNAAFDVIDAALRQDQP